VDETALVAALFVRLQGDATLRALLSKTSAPYGVYAAGHIPLRDPSFPIVTLDFQTAVTGSSPWQTGVMMVTVIAYSGNMRQIQARIARILRPGHSPLTPDEIQVTSMRINQKGLELYHDKYRVHYRPDTLLIGHLIHGDAG